MPDPKAAEVRRPDAAPLAAPSRIRRRLVVTIGGLAILALSFGVVWLQSSKYAPLTVGMTDPDFAFPEMAGKSPRRSGYGGQLLSPNMWAAPSQAWTRS